MNAFQTISVLSFIGAALFGIYAVIEDISFEVRKRREIKRAAKLIEMRARWAEMVSADQKLFKE